MNPAIRHIINACNPEMPATREFYVDTSEARGDNRFIKDYLRRIANADRPTCELFSGHIGCGKSSELHKLFEILKEDSHPEECPRIFPVFLDADEYLNLDDVTPNDILLAIASELGIALQEREGITLADNYLTRKLREIWSGLNTDIGVDKIEAGVGKKLTNDLADLKITLKPLPKDETARQEVQNALRTHATRISTELNLALTEALGKLKDKSTRRKERPYSAIVVIIDSLERIRHVKGCDNVEESWGELFIRNAELLRGVEAHVIYTVPLGLVRSVEENLEAAYRQQASILPMVTVEKRHGGAPYAPGLECLRQLIARRVGDLPLTGGEGVFTEEALKLLLRYCGGHPRHLLRFVVAAALQVDTLPIDIKAAQKGIIPTVRDFQPKIPSAYYAKMVKVVRDPEHQVDNSDEDYLKMLRQNWVLEYVNGSDSRDAFESVAPWYGVHPIIRELAPFKAAMAASSVVSS